MLQAVKRYASSSKKVAMSDC